MKGQPFMHGKGKRTFGNYLQTPNFSSYWQNGKNRKLSADKIFLEQFWKIEVQTMSLEGMAEISGPVLVC